MKSLQLCHHGAATSFSCCSERLRVQVVLGVGGWVGGSLETEGGFRLKGLGPVPTSCACRAEERFVFLGRCSITHKLLFNCWIGSTLVYIYIYIYICLYIYIYIYIYICIYTCESIRSYRELSSAQIWRTCMALAAAVAAATVYIYIYMRVHVFRSTRAIPPPGLPETERSRSVQCSFEYTYNWARGGGGAGAMGPPPKLVGRPSYLHRPGPVLAQIIE